jgi:hypothetical protein
MTIFPLAFSRFADFIAVCFGRRKHSFPGVMLESLSDQSLKDMGIEPWRRDLDTVKPFWMP